MNYKLVSLIFFFLLELPFGESQRTISQNEVIQEVNKIRSKGCYCGSEFMPKAQAVSWNERLFQSARDHAIEMYQYDYFSHISIEGLDVGQRVERFGYRWHFAGENLAKGQRSLRQVLKDWLKSESHCKMLMDPRMREMGMYKFKTIWVQHFGKKLPPNTKRVRESYTEG